MSNDVSIRGETIDLDQFLKLAGVVGSGGEVKHLVGEGLVRVNDEPESRRRRTLRVGDVVAIDGAGAWRVTARTDA